MKHSKRNLTIALGLAASLVVPGLAMADNWQQPSWKYSVKQQHQREYRHEQHFAQREHRDRHEWREHQRRHRFERDAYYHRHQWREHEREYYELRRHHGYGLYPSAFRTGIVVVPAPRLVIDLR